MLFFSLSIIGFLIVNYLIYYFSNKKRSLAVWTSWTATTIILLGFLSYMSYIFKRISDFSNKHIETDFLDIIKSLMSNPKTYIEFATFATLIALIQILLDNLRELQQRPAKDSLKEAQKNLSVAKDEIEKSKEKIQNLEEQLQGQLQKNESFQEDISQQLNRLSESEIQGIKELHRLSSLLEKRATANRFLKRRKHGYFKKGN